jgi:hypothetical protein
VGRCTLETSVLESLGTRGSEVSRGPLRKTAHAQHLRAQRVLGMLHSLIFPTEDRPPFKRLPFSLDHFSQAHSHFPCVLGILYVLGGRIPGN